MIEISLRLINVDDLFNLRQWKNNHREAFFFKGEISFEQQEKWLDEYQKRHDDYMFIVLADDIEIGCMGIRLIDNIWDIYNVILGLQEYGGRGLMSRALGKLIYFAISIKPVTIVCKTLKNNFAVNWYKKNRFVIISEEENHYNMLYQGDYL